MVDTRPQEDEQIIQCPKGGLKGVERHWHFKSGKEQILISHPFKILRIDDPSVKKSKKTKRCIIGNVSTETWDLPKTDEGYQIVLIQLLESLDKLASIWSDKSSNTEAGRRYHKRMEELRIIIDQYQRFKPTEAELEGEMKK
jgi:hypothetical protein